MLTIAEISALAERAARKWIDLERVLVEPTVDSQGEEALRVTLVLDPRVVERVTGDQALDLLVDIKQAVRAAGDERLPIIYYAIEEDLAAENVA